MRESSFDVDLDEILAEGESVTFGNGPPMPDDSDLWENLPWPDGYDPKHWPTGEQLITALEAATDEQRLDLARCAVFDHWAMGKLLATFGVEVVGGVLAGEVSLGAASIVEVRPVN